MYLAYMLLGIWQSFVFQNVFRQQYNISHCKCAFFLLQITNLPLQLRFISNQHIWNRPRHHLQWLFRFCNCDATFCNVQKLLFRFFGQVYFHQGHILICFYGNYLYLQPLFSNSNNTNCNNTCPSHSINRNNNSNNSPIRNINPGQKGGELVPEMTRQPRPPI